jgi:hypothetical protein
MWAEGRPRVRIVVVDLEAALKRVKKVKSTKMKM